MSEHKSDCAVHNAPAYKPGPCDCGADEKFGLYSNEWIAEQQNKLAELLEALEPFAKASIDDDADDNVSISTSPSAVLIVQGNLRHAAAVYEKAKAEGTE